MPAASNKDGPAAYGLTPREIEVTVKAMMTHVDNNVKPDFEKLAKMSNYQNATAAARNWYHVATKLKAAASKVDGEDGASNTNEDKKAGKREAADDPVAPPAKRGRGRGRPKKPVQPTTEEDEAEAGEI
ncbi:hypothetical protein Daus18300_002932 [Diaporthe australafricana]|uniref:Uncharacterized protein n=1 Tax=Diaporthe australafricana TaxID=127596 RepID=A0ABR3XK00_9PEZI